MAVRTAVMPRWLAFTATHGAPGAATLSQEQVTLPFSVRWAMPPPRPDEGRKPTAWLPVRPENRATLPAPSRGPGAIGGSRWIRTVGGESVCSSKRIEGSVDILHLRRTQQGGLRGPPPGPALAVRGGRMPSGAGPCGLCVCWSEEGTAGLGLLEGALGISSQDYGYVTTHPLSGGVGPSSKAEGAVEGSRRLVCGAGQICWETLDKWLLWSQLRVYKMWAPLPPHEAARTERKRQHLALAHEPRGPFPEVRGRRAAAATRSRETTWRGCGCSRGSRGRSLWRASLCDQEGRRLWGHSPRVPSPWCGCSPAACPRRRACG